MKNVKWTNLEKGTSLADVLIKRHQNDLKVQYKKHQNYIDDLKKSHLNELNELEI